jgi:hypothetical protein
MAWFPSWLGVASGRCPPLLRPSADDDAAVRHEERRPKLSGEVNSPDGGESYQLAVTLDAAR